MNLRDYLHIAPTVSAALRAGKPVVALESVVLSHSIPWPENLALADEMQRLVRAEGVVPAIVAVVDGVFTVGLSGAALERMCKHGAKKASRRDLSILAATGGTGAATVSASMVIACLAGIRVLAAGGVGGVHRGAAQSMDVSADLQELRQTPVAVVCGGANPLLDVRLTLEYLETIGVPVLGLRTDDFPAFYCRNSGFPVDYNVQSEAELARILKLKWDLGLKGGVLIGNPVPEDCAMAYKPMQAVIANALAGAAESGVRGRDVTPWLLARIAAETGADAQAIHQRIACGNACAAAKIAAAYTKL